MKPLLISSGEPAGIGPDLCLDLAFADLPVVIVADKELLQSRAKDLKKFIIFKDYVKNEPVVCKPAQLTVLSTPCPAPVQAGVLDKRNASYVIELLELTARCCLEGEFSGIVTAPVHKAIINQAGIPFTGHTEFFAEFYGVDSVVMLLACDEFKVALVTTHLPLRQVPDAVTGARVTQVITQVYAALQKDFGIKNPKIRVAGLNPHAGESGYLGREEIEIIQPALDILRAQGLNVTGPLSADTLFSEEAIKNCDAFVTMYHDQGLPVLKYAGFGRAVNITVGLPVIRTSVDHGTALELAGKNLANSGSLLAAVKMAATMVAYRESTLI